MGQLIRGSVFETNSSSTHSIVIDEGTDYTSIAHDDGVIRITPGVFGWSKEKFDQPEDKLSYLLLYIRDWVGNETQKAMFMTTLQSVVEAQTGAHRVELTGSNSSYEEGYIDHQSVENEDLHDLLGDPVELKQFIFGVGSYVMTDNDNY